MSVEEILGSARGGTDRDKQLQVTRSDNSCPPNRPQSRQNKMIGRLDLIQLTEKAIKNKEKTIANYKTYIAQRGVNDPGAQHMMAAIDQIQDEISNARKTIQYMNRKL